MTADERRALDVLRIEISGKLDLIAAGIEQLKIESTDHEKRLRSVEVWKNAIPVALIISAAGIVLAILRAG